MASVASCRQAPAPVAAPGFSGSSLHVAAASDLALAFAEIGRRFDGLHGTHTTFVFGSTGLLARQIQQGAPFDVFAAADVAILDQVLRAGRCDGKTRALYARGRLAVWSRKGPRAPESLADLADPRFAHIALANPEHAPYGRAAKQALERAGVLQAVAARLVPGENVRQALQYAQSGNADAALVALSLVKHDMAGHWFVVDEMMHQPLQQALAVCASDHSTAGARAFAEFVTSPSGRAVLADFGFGLPPGAAP